MTKQTEQYIILKPLANRFAEISKSISDDEIRSIIKDGLKNKIDEQLDNMNIPLEEIVSDWFDDDTNIILVIDMIKKSIESRLYGKNYRY